MHSINIPALDAVDIRNALVNLMTDNQPVPASQEKLERLVGLLTPTADDSPARAPVVADELHALHDWLCSELMSHRGGGQADAEIELDALVMAIAKSHGLALPVEHTEGVPGKMHALFDLPALGANRLQGIIDQLCQRTPGLVLEWDAYQGWLKGELARLRDMIVSDEIDSLRHALYANGTELQAQVSDLLGVDHDSYLDLINRAEERGLIGLDG